MSEDNFQWTDSLVKEYLRLITSVEGNDYWQQEINKFKASKTPVKDYEILLCEPDEVITTYPPQFKKGKILSVKRLSDNEVFSIGDEVRWGVDIGNFSSKILEFYIQGTSMFFKHSAFDADMDFINSPYNLRKVKQPLFLTEDNVPVYEGDEVWWVFTTETSFGTWKPIKMGAPKHHLDNEKYFSTEQAASQFCLLNKPCLSVNDVIKVSEWYNRAYAHEFRRFKLFDLTELAKQKLSQ